jgi:hypothetical protein
MAPPSAAFPFATAAASSKTPLMELMEDADAKECALCRRAYGKSNGIIVLQDGPMNAGLDTRLGCAHWACGDCWQAVGSVRANPCPDLTHSTCAWSRTRSLAARQRSERVDPMVHASRRVTRASRWGEHVCKGQPVCER